MLDPVEFGKSMGALILAATAPLVKQNKELEARINELESRQLQKGDKGEPGKDAVAPTKEEIASALLPMLDDAVSEKLVKLIPAPLKGDKGDRGENGVAPTKEDIAAALLPMLDETITERIAKSMPQPVKGDKGDAGLPGKDAEPIEVSEVAREVAVCPEIKTVIDLLIAESVSVYAAAHPAKDGQSATQEQIEKSVASYLKANPPAKGEDGKDGVGVAGAMIDRDGQLIVTTTKGDAIRLGVVVGKHGDPGTDGQDFSDVSLDYDGERTLKIKNRTGGEIVKRLPIPMDKGYWREGMSCEKADVVTHQGNAWIAKRDTQAKPCLENPDDWRLLARKGKDGNDGTPGRNLGPPPPVKLKDA